MKTSEILHAWAKILKGERPSLSIEITRECPLRCPGCYAYNDAHLGGELTLRNLNDSKGQELSTAYSTSWIVSNLSIFRSSVAIRWCATGNYRPWCRCCWRAEFMSRS